MKEYFLMWQNAFNFQGRSRRREYWIPCLINVIIGLVFTILIYATQSYVFKALKYLYIILGIIPSISLSVRRLHDLGKSGWFWFISLIPFLGTIYLIYLACKDSQIGSNKWGADPKKNERKSASFSV